MFNKKAYAMGTNRSQIRDIAEYGASRAAVVGPENVFDFSIGNPSIPAPRQVDDTVRQIMAEMDSLDIHSYTSAQGEYATRQAIADDLNSRYGTAVTPEELFLGGGASSELAAVFRALSVPGGEVVAIAPYFPEYRPFVEGAGMELKIVPADIPGFQIRMDKLEAVLSPNTQAVIINSPNNPAGTVYTEETIRRLSRLLTQKAEEFGHPIYIVSDDPYRELTYDGVVATFVPTVYSNTIVCYSYSKSLSLPGERIGYIYVPSQAENGKELYAAVAGASRANGHICAPSLWQKVLARCAHLRPDLGAYDRNRRFLYEGLVAAGYEVAKPDGAFYLFVKAPGGSAWEFCQKAMKKDVLVVPGDSFGCPEYFRMCYCVSYDTIQRSLPIFRELIEE